MSAYNPPSVSLPIFDTLVFEPSDTPLTYSLAKKYFLTYPTAQGSETLQKVGQAIGNNNIQFGDLTSFTSTSGANNIAIGNATLPVLSSGNQNVAIGTGALNIATTGYDNTAVGYYALGDDITTHNGVTAIGSLAGRHSIGSNSTYLGHQTGQQSTDASTYNYLTCIGTLSGREASVCASNRIILGSSTGNENILMAGSGDIAHRDAAKTINMFTGTTANINIGADALTIGGTPVNGVYAGAIRLHRFSSTIASVSPASVSNLMIQCSGVLRLGSDTNTTGNIIIGPNTGTATNTINIGPQQTTSNIILHNANADSGRIVMNRNIVLPSTGFVTPAAGELGYSTTRTANLTGTTTFNSTSAALTNTIGNIATMTFPSVGVFNVYVRVKWTKVGSSNAVVGRLGFDSTSGAITDQAGSVDNYYFTGSLWNTTPAAMDYMGMFTTTVTNASTTYYLTGQFAVATGGDSLTANAVSFLVTRIA